MKVQISKAELKDWKAIQRLNNEVFINDMNNDEFLDLNWPYSLGGVKYYREVVSNPKYCCLIAKVENKPVGYLVGGRKYFGYRKAKVAEIQNMGVTQKYRSKGIGSQLIQKFRKWCREHSFQRVYVTAYIKNKKALKFYERQGLKPIDISFESNTD